MSIVYDPSAQKPKHSCPVTSDGTWWFTDTSGAVRFKNEHMVIGTVLKCICGKHWIAVKPLDPGRVTVYWIPESFLRRWWRDWKNSEGRWAIGIIVVLCSIFAVAAIAAIIQAFQL